MPVINLSPERYELLDGPDTELAICDAVLFAFGRSIMCSGIDPNREVAYAKMLSEAAERFAYLDSLRKPNPPSSSTGFAAHVSPEAAAMAASNELIERSFIDRLRRPPKSLRPDEATTCTWRYRILEHNCWFCLARGEATNASGWGCAVDTDNDRAATSALREAILMASSFQTYGRRGNSITTLTGGADHLGGRIHFWHFPEVIVHNELRHVCRASWNIE